MDVKVEGLDIWAKWLLYRRYGGSEEIRRSVLRLLNSIRVKILQNALISSGKTVLDIGSGDGFLAFAALQQVGESGTVIFCDISEDLLEICRIYAENLQNGHLCRFVRAAAEDLHPIEEESCDAVTMRCVLIYVGDKARVFREFHRVLKEDGRFSIYEPINCLLQDYSVGRLWGYDTTGIEPLASRIIGLYRDIQGGDSNYMLNFDDRDLLKFAEAAGFRDISLELRVEFLSVPPRRRWEDFTRVSPNPMAPTPREAMESVLNSGEQEQFVSYMKPRVEQGIGFPVRSAHVYLCGRK